MQCDAAALSHSAAPASASVCSLPKYSGAAGPTHDESVMLHSCAAQLSFGTRHEHGVCIHPSTCALVAWMRAQKRRREGSVELFRLSTAVLHSSHWPLHAE